MLFDPFPYVLMAEHLAVPLTVFPPSSRPLPVCENCWDTTASLWWSDYCCLLPGEIVWWVEGRLSTVVSSLKSTWQVRQVRHFKNNFKADNSLRRRGGRPACPVLSYTETNLQADTNTILLRYQKPFKHIYRLSYI